MKNYLLLAFTSLIFINNSCVSDDFNDEIIRTEVVETPIPGKFKKNVLIEDYTGTWCIYCPKVNYGIEKVKEENLDAYPVAIHRSSGSSIDPFNFNALVLENNFGVSSYPSARLDRSVKWNNVTNPFEVKKRMSPNSDLGITVNSSLNSGTIDLNIDIKFANNLSGLKLVVYLLEDNLIYDQANVTQYFGGVNPIVGFEHDHVLRSCLTDLLNGNPISGSTNGNVVSTNFNLTVPSNILNADNISFVAFVIDSEGNVVNARGAHINDSQTFQENY